MTTGELVCTVCHKALSEGHAKWCVYKNSVSTVYHRVRATYLPPKRLMEVAKEVEISDCGECMHFRSGQASRPYTSPTKAKRTRMFLCNNPESCETGLRVISFNVWSESSMITRDFPSWCPLEIV